MQSIDYSLIVPETEIDDIDTDNDILILSGTYHNANRYMVDDAEEDFQFSGELNFN